MQNWLSETFILVLCSSGTTTAPYCFPSSKINFKRVVNNGGKMQNENCGRFNNLLLKILIRYLIKSISNYMATSTIKKQHVLALLLRKLYEWFVVSALLTVLN